MFIERFYLSVFMLLTPLLLLLFCHDGRRILLYSSPIVVLMVVIFVIRYSVLFDGFGERLAEFRAAFLDRSDVSSLNRDLPYPFLVAKLWFTPFFSFGKFDVFTGLSAIIIWGSFVTNVFMAVLVFTGVSLAKDFYRLLPIYLPVFLFIFIFGYFAPYSGRTRDSFMPIFTIIVSVYCISRIEGVPVSDYWGRIIRLRD